MGRTLEELGNTMSSSEFGLHFELEIMRHATPDSDADAQLRADMGL